MAKLLKYEKHVDVDRSRDNVLLQKKCSPGDPCRMKPLFPEPSKRFLMPTDEERVSAVDAAYDYILDKAEEGTEAEENIRRAIAAAAFFMGMSAMAALCWFLGYFNVGV